MPEFDYVVCMPVGRGDLEHIFPDNVRAKCCECGCAIYHRPYVPADVPKICLPCIGKVAELRKLMESTGGRPH